MIWEHRGRRIIFIQEYKNLTQLAYFNINGHLTNSHILPFILDVKPKVTIDNNKSVIYFNPTTTLADLEYKTISFSDRGFLNPIKSYLYSVKFDAKLNNLLSSTDDPLE